MLGEFEVLGLEGLETYPKANRNLLYIYFLMATFLTQVVFFNVLVAIISEKYTERWAKKDAYGMMEQVQIFNDFGWLIEANIPKERFLYVVEPFKEVENEDGVDVESVINTMKTTLEDRIEKLDNKMNDTQEQIKNLTTLIQDGFDQMRK